MATRLRGGSGTSPTVGGPSPTSPTSPTETASEAPIPTGGPVNADLAADAPMPGENAAGIPARFVKLVRNSYPYQKPEPASEVAVRSQQEQTANTRNNNYEMLRPATNAFEARWAAYAKRKAEVDRVLASAQALEKAGKLAEAQAQLEALVATTPAGGGGERALVEPRDAEVPALHALAGIAVARRTATVAAIPTLFRVAAGLWTRRTLRDHDDELLYWLAFDDKADNRLRMWEGQDAAILAARRRSERPVNEGAIAAYKTLEQSGSKDLVALVREQAGSQDRWPKLFDEAAAHATRFEQAWRPYAERTRVVAAAIAEAEAAEQAGKHADARAKLAAAITQTDPGVARGWIEARDAELPAVTVLQRVTKTQQDWRAFVVDVTAAMWSRRQLGDADRELAAFILRGTKQYDASDPASGPTLARAWLHQLTAAGLPAGVPEQELVVPRGAWFVAELPTNNWQNQAKTLTLSGRSLRFKLVIDANDKFCKKTNRVDRIDPDGSVRYEEECTYKPRKDTYTAEAALAEAAPAWALDVARTGGQKHERMYVLGKLAAAGGPRAWRLQNAVILDLRFAR